MNIYYYCTFLTTPVLRYSVYVGTGGFYGEGGSQLSSVFFSSPLFGGICWELFLLACAQVRSLVGAFSVLLVPAVLGVRVPHG